MGRMRQRQASSSKGYIPSSNTFCAYQTSRQNDTFEKEEIADPFDSQTQSSLI
jgi:hypothetical protein